MNRVNRMAWPWRRGLALCLPLAMAPLAQAQTCWSSSGGTLAFGTVTASAPTNTQTTVNLTCQGVYGQVTHARYCVYVNEVSQSGSGGGIAPRWMTNNNANNTYANMAFEVYSDASRTQIIGPPGSGYTVYSGTLQLPNNGQNSVNIPIYGRVPAGQNLPAGNYQAQVNGNPIQWAIQATSAPASCTGGTASGTATFYLGVTATYSSGCTVGVSATDLDFGSVSSLATAHDGTSTITLSCPPSTSWKLGLSSGLHASGTQRRMAGPAGQYVRYELYRDAGRTQRWGNDTASGSDTVNGSGGSPSSIPVYGRVPAQTEVDAGTYSDTVTVTITY